MKGFFHIILTFFFLIASFACAPGDNEKKFVIGVSQYAMSDTWRKAMVTDMEVEALNFPDFQLVVKDALQNDSLQSVQIRDFIEDEVDLMIISTNGLEDMVKSAMQDAYTSGIPTVILDQKPNFDQYTTYIGADNYEIGRSVGVYISSLLGEKKSAVLEICGRESSSSAKERHLGFSEVISTHPNVTVHQIRGLWSPDLVYETIDKLGSLESVDVVFAHNDKMALGAYDAIAKRDSALAKRIHFVGVDGLLGKGFGVEAIVDGKLNASFYYPTGGRDAIKVAWQILNGYPCGKRLVLSTTLIDKEKAGALYLQSYRLMEYLRQIDHLRTSYSQMLSKYNWMLGSLIIIIVLALIVGGSAVYFIRINRKMKHKNHQLREKNLLVQHQKEELSVANKRIEQITAQKLRFFTNVSHEIKTPLTLILGPLNKIEQDVASGSFSDDIRIVRKNAERLKRVIDQLLDFRKVENNRMNMRVNKIELVSFVKEVMSLFDNLAQTKAIEYTFTHSMKQLNVWVDTDKMEKILANLLSNSFKFTPNRQGKISISLEEEDKFFSLSVTDNGVGIPAENIGSVFERFYTSSQDRAIGTGIGLHLTREFVHMHKGTIQVKSEPNKQTVFTVRIPKGKDHFDESCVIVMNATENSSSIDDLDISSVNEALQTKYDYSVLVVEDNQDIRDYLRKELGHNFRIFTAENGVKALELLMQEEISLVVTDVMMPAMNGFELCRRIKSDMALSYIPVILLTALTDDSQRMYAFEGGADSYIQKPFNIEVVKLRIIKLLEERNRLREVFLAKYQSASDLSFLPSEKEGSMDDQFMRKFIALIDENYADSAFSIEKGSEKLGLSRVHLYRKVKELSGVTPTEFLRDYRLKKASIMLKQKQGTISEIAYATGFSSPAYFSKCFKAVYTITPSEFMESKE